MHRTRTVPLVLALLAAWSCAPRNALDPMAVVGRNPNLLPSVEILQTDAQTVHDAVRRLRPQWLRTRGQTSLVGGVQPVVVYVNGSRYGGPEALANIRVDAVDSLEYVDALSAQQRFGNDHTNGAILVDLR